MYNKWYFHKCNFSKPREQTNSMKIAMEYLHKHLHAIQIITAANT